jgi:hypothetical protein
VGFTIISEWIPCLFNAFKLQNRHLQLASDKDKTKQAFGYVFFFASTPYFFVYTTNKETGIGVRAVSTTRLFFRLQIYSHKGHVICVPKVNIKVIHRADDKRTYEKLEGNPVFFSLK